jgi:hypothetical protein
VLFGLIEMWTKKNKGVISLCLFGGMEESMQKNREYTNSMPPCTILTNLINHYLSTLTRRSFFQGTMQTSCPSENLANQQF